MMNKFWIKNLINPKPVVTLQGYPQSFHSKHFIPLLENKARILLLMGGAGSGKSRFCALKVLHRIIFEQEGQRILLVRKIHKNIRRSSWQLINDIIYSWHLRDYFTINKSEMSLTYEPNGNQIISAGMDDPEKIKSIERITSIWAEEATELTRDDFIQLDIRMRGKHLGIYKQILASFNPISKYHWINEDFFIDNKIWDDYTINVSTVDNNEFIDSEYKKRLESLKRIDINKYNIYRNAVWGELQDQIFSNFTYIDKWAPKGEKIYGLDFGFVNPSALIEIHVNENDIYIRELIYESGLKNRDLIRKMKWLKISNQKYIYADAAEPNRIEEIQAEGYNIHPAKKDIIAGIDYVKSLNLLIDSESVNIKKEVENYSYKKDKNGKKLEEPVKVFDHAMDAIRYALYTYYMENLGFEDYSNWVGSVIED